MNSHSRSRWFSTAKHFAISVRTSLKVSRNAYISRMIRYNDNNARSNSHHNYPAPPSIATADDASTTYASAASSTPGPTRGPTARTCNDTRSYALGSKHRWPTAKQSSTNTRNPPTRSTAESTGFIGPTSVITSLYPISRRSTTHTTTE